METIILHTLLFNLLQCFGLKKHIQKFAPYETKSEYANGSDPHIPSNRIPEKKKQAKRHTTDIYFPDTEKHY